MLRLSGPGCRDVLAVHLGREASVARHVYYGAFRTKGSSIGQTSASADAPASAPASTTASMSRPDSDIIDRLNFVFFPGPASSTGEDVLELFPHGNPLIIDGILKVLLSHPGLRLAEPGEFTRRSFENGKIDLLQAEAVGELIHAETIEALKNAQRIVGGALSGAFKTLRDELLDLSARLELEVDFSEEEVDPDFASWAPRLESLSAGLRKIASGFERGRSLARARRVAILGAPNAGKSSLINALIEADRLLVSDRPGTTRDYVEVPLRLKGGIVHLVDTAGLGRPIDGLDALAMQRTREQWQAADVCVWVEDGTGTSTREVTEAESLGQGEIQSDAQGDAQGETVSLRLATKMDLPGFKARPEYLSLSSRTGEGLAEFRERLNAMVFVSASMGEDIVITTERQFQTVELAQAKVTEALEMLQQRPAIELVAFEIREAALHLKELLGEISSDEILQRVFAGYCIGK